MCCLFGFVDYAGSLSVKQRNRLIRELSIAAEARGTDATGIAYNTSRGLQVYKRPLAAHRLHLRIPAEARAVMGHTRMTTQGSAKKNYNNHPFFGHVKEESFALAHNGVLWNDLELRHAKHLPRTKVQTDSYIAVQLLEQKKSLDFDSLRYMAEQVEGSFSFTVLFNQIVRQRLEIFAVGWCGAQEKGTTDNVVNLTGFGVFQGPVLRQAD